MMERVNMAVAGFFIGGFLGWFMGVAWYEFVEVPKAASMLARFRIILPVLLTALVSAQGATAQQKSQREQDGLVGQVRTVRIERAQLLNEAGKYIEGPRALSETKIYDTDGRLLERADYLPGGASDTKSTYKYDFKGKEIEHAHYIHDALVYKWLSAYDATGKLSEKIELRANGQMEARYLYKYNIKENRSQITEFGPDSSVKSKRTEVYDSRGNVLARIERNSNGSVVHKYAYTFDGSGYLTSETDQYKDNGSPRASRTAYTYDDKRNMVEESRYSNGSLSTKESYRYNDNGNKIEVTRYNSDGTVEEQVAITYDEYDSTGNWIKATISPLKSRSPETARSSRYTAYRIITYLGDISVELLLAVQEGDLSRIKALLEQGSGVNSKDADGRTALVIAAKQGHSEIAEFLLGRGAETDARDNEGWTALMWASEYRHIEIIKLLLSKGANVNARSKAGGTAMMAAATQNNIEVARYLLAKGADLNAKAEDGSTALMTAGHEGHEEMVELLLANDADINANTKDGLTALMFSVFGGNAEITRALVERGADIDAKASNGATSLMLAAVEGKLDIAKLLVNKGADIDAKTTDGKTALNLAAQAGHSEIVQLLKRAGAKQ